MQVAGQIRMRGGDYIYPGSNLGASYGEYQTTVYIASHTSYGLYTNTGMYFAGSAYAPAYRDIAHSYNYLGFEATNLCFLHSANNVGCKATWDGTNWHPNPDVGGNIGTPYARWSSGYIYYGVTVGSDARDKRDVRPTIYGRQFLAALQPVDYNWIRGEFPGRYSGFLAQQIAGVAPDFGGISYGPDGVASGLNYQHFIAPLVAGWQDHEARIVALEKRLHAE
jgi:hypothetical protein